MQGRLSKSSSGKIQEFPSTTWKSEFKKANKLGLNKIEWTVDFDNFKSNPIFLKFSQSEIRELTSRFNVGVDSITLDNFVEAPIHKTNEGSGKRSKLSDFVWITENLFETQIRTLVLPIVNEAGSFTNIDLDNLIKSLNEITKHLHFGNFRVAVECEFNLNSIKKMLDLTDPDFIGINFDMGNSAGLGHDAENELNICKGRIFNVHIKDRTLGGKTTKLGTGDVQFNVVAESLKTMKYEGNLILQVAREFNKDEYETVKEWVDFCKMLGWTND
jgi:sugar phosphate isomerase/epimerase